MRRTNADGAGVHTNDFGHHEPGPGPGKRTRTASLPAQPRLAGPAAELSPSPAGVTPEPLPSALAFDFGYSFGADLSSVRVSTDEGVARAGALAVTQGEHIRFAPSAWDPGSATGRELVGHELTHVMQQREGRAGNVQQPTEDPAAGGTSGMHVDPALEAEADAVGAQAASGANASAGMPLDDGGGYVWQFDGSAAFTCIRTPQGTAPAKPIIVTATSNPAAWEKLDGMWKARQAAMTRSGATPGASPAAAPPPAPTGGSGSSVIDLIPGLGSVVDLASDAYDQAAAAASAWWVGGSEAEATPASTTAPRTADGAQPGPAPASAEIATGSELDTLMASDRLTVEQISRARELIASEVPEAERAAYYEALQTKVEYLNQRNNTSWQEDDGGGTCNVTAIAMCLTYLGVPNPDPSKQYEDALVDICIENGWTNLTQGSTWMKLGEHMGVKLVPQHAGQGINPKSWFETTLREWLQGGSVFVSIHGHIIRIQAVTETGLMVDDPYGASGLVGTTDRSWEDADGNSTINDDAKDGVDGSAAGNKGEDHTWPWETVLAFSFKCFYTVNL